MIGPFNFFGFTAMQHTQKTKHHITKSLFKLTNSNQIDLIKQEVDSFNRWKGGLGFNAKKARGIL